jgi:hypothetical protein
VVEDNRTEQVVRGKHQVRAELEADIRLRSKTPGSL